MCVLYFAQDLESAGKYTKEARKIEVSPVKEDFLTINILAKFSSLA